MLPVSQFDCCAVQASSYAFSARRFYVDAIFTMIEPANKSDCL